MKIRIQKFLEHFLSRKYGKGVMILAACALTAGALCCLLNLVRLPSTWQGVPSWQWVPDGMKVRLDNGDCVRYLTRKEEKILQEKYGRVWVTVSWAKYDPYYLWQKRWGTDVEVPNILVVGEVTAVRNLVYIPKEGNIHYDNSFSIVTMDVEEVLFDVREEPILAGESVTFVSMDSQVYSDTVGYPPLEGNRYYLTLELTETRTGGGFSRFMREQAQYLNYADLRTRWPVLDGKVYDFPGVTRREITNPGQFTMDHNATEEESFREKLLPRIASFVEKWEEKKANAQEA